MRQDSILEMTGRYRSSRSNCSIFREDRPMTDPPPFPFAKFYRCRDTFGVLKLTLHPTSYDWDFVPEAGKTFKDSGSGTCH